MYLQLSLSSVRLYVLNLFKFHTGFVLSKDKSQEMKQNKLSYIVSVLRYSLHRKFVVIYFCVFTVKWLDQPNSPAKLFDRVSHFKILTPGLEYWSGNFTFSL